MKRNITIQEYDRLNLKANKMFMKYKRNNNLSNSIAGLEESLITFDVFKKHGYDKLDLNILN